jgi:hypothetical protein
MTLRRLRIILQLPLRTMSSDKRCEQTTSGGGVRAQLRSQNSTEFRESEFPSILAKNAVNSKSCKNRTHYSKD